MPQIRPEAVQRLVKITLTNSTTPTRLTLVPGYLIGVSVMDQGGAAGVIEIGTSDDSVLAAASMTAGMIWVAAIASGAGVSSPDWLKGTYCPHGIIIRTRSSGAASHNWAVLFAPLSATQDVEEDDDAVEIRGSLTKKPLSVPLLGSPGEAGTGATPLEDRVGTGPAPPPGP